MKRGLRRWILRIGLAGLLIAASAVALLIGTEAGTHWLVARATPYLPAALESGTVSGTLLRGLRFDGIGWREAPAVVSVGTVRLEVALLPILRGRIEIESLDAIRVDVRLVPADTPAEAGGPLDIDLPVTILLASATIRDIVIRMPDADRRLDSVALAGRMAGPDLRVTELAVGSDWLIVAANAEVALTEPYPAELEVNWRWSETGRPAFAGEFSLRGRAARYDVEHKLTTPVALATHGTIAVVNAGPAANLVNEWQDLEWPLADARQIRSPQGSLRLTGNLQAFDATLDALVQVGQWPETRVAGVAGVNRDSIGIEQLELRNEWGRLTTKGVVDRLPAPLWQLEFELADLDPSHAYEGLAGTIELAGRTRGRLVNGAPQSAELGIERIAGVLNGQPVEGALAVSYDDDTLTITDLALGVGANRIQVAGSARETLDLDVSLDLSAMHELVPDAQGSLAANLLINGSPSLPSLAGEVTGSSLAWRGLSVGALSASGQLSGSGPSDAIVGLTDVVLPAVTLDSVTIRASGEPDAHRIESAISTFGNTLSLSASGGLGEQGWDGALESFSARSDVLGEWSLREQAPLAISAIGTRLERACVSSVTSSGNACIEIAAPGAGRLEFDATLQALPLAALPLGLPEDTSAAGVANAEVRGVRRDGSLTGQARLRLDGAVLSTIIDGETVSMTLADASMNIDVADNRLESVVTLALAEQLGGMDLRLDVDDLSNTRSPIDGRGSLEIADVGGAAVFLPDLVDPRGRISGSLAIAGTLAAPEFVGEVGLLEGAFGLRRAGIEITELDLRLRQMAAGRLAIQGSARSGEGQLSIAGETTVGAAAGIRSEVRISGDDFEIVRLPDWQVSASPDITLVLDDRIARVTGSLDIPRADIVVKSIPETAQQPSPDAVVNRSQAEAPPRGRRIDVSVQTSLGKDVRLSGFGLTTRLEGGVDIEGSSQTPYRGLGTLSLREGRYKAFGQDLDIERGELIFNGPLDNPELDVRAIRHTTDGVVAGITITGRPRRLRSEVFSEPPLPDAEALSYLMTGRPLTSATAGEGDLMNQAAFALGMSQAGQVAAQLRTELGLETLAVEGGADSGRIVAGKRIGGRLLVEYGYGFIDNLGTLLLRYQLSDRLSVESRTGSVSTFDVVYSVRKK